MAGFPWDEIQQACRDSIPLASDVVAAEFAEQKKDKSNPTPDQSTAKVFGISAQYVRNVRDLGCLGSYDNCLIKIVMKILTASQKEEQKDVQPNSSTEKH